VGTVDPSIPVQRKEWWGKRLIKFHESFCVRK
jgi:hypothetical protein